jgi:hypothetical protein
VVRSLRASRLARTSRRAARGIVASGRSGRQARHGPECVCRRSRLRRMPEDLRVTEARSLAERRRRPPLRRSFLMCITIHGGRGDFRTGALLATYWQRPNFASRALRCTRIAAPKHV